MIELIVICRLGGSGDIADDSVDAERYAQLKSWMLRYCQVLLCQGANVWQGPMGAVRSRADGERLIAAFSRAFPQYKFASTKRLCEEADEVVFVPNECRRIDGGQVDPYFRVGNPALAS